jgi:chromosomal replication initiator protein
MKDNYINKQYTLENFVLDNQNNLAYEEIKNIIDKNNIIYNPICIYGANGVGKTHLLKALYESQENKKSKYITIYDFMNDFVNNIANNTMDDFRNLYKNLDILIIDDFEFIINKEETQKELYQIINYLMNKNKIIVISSSIRYDKLSLHPKLYYKIISGNIINI